MAGKGGKGGKGGKEVKVVKVVKLVSRKDQLNPNQQEQDYNSQSEESIDS